MRFRRGLLITIGSGCLILGAMLTVTMIRPETLQTMGTLELGAIVGFVVMPVLTMFSIRYDRVIAKRVRLAEEEQVSTQSPIMHDAHVRVLKLERFARLSDTREPMAYLERHQKTRDSIEAA